MDRNDCSFTPYILGWHDGYCGVVSFNGGTADQNEEYARGYQLGSTQRNEDDAHPRDVDINVAVDDALMFGDWELDLSIGPS